MTGSLRALLSGLIDYAGLFPPAQLPLEDALRRFARDREGPDAPLLGRFVIPAARMSDVALHATLFAPGGGAPFAALARGGADAEEALAGLERDLVDCSEFLARHGDAVAVEALEMKIPPGLLPGPEEVSEFVTRVLEVISERSPVPLDVFFEGIYGPDWYRGLSTAIAALGSPRAPARKAVRCMGFKLRCGGTEPAEFPPVEQIAAALALCRDLRVPFKATAGLHHPVRHLDHALMVKAHGFINVFGAAVLAYSCGLDEATLAEAVADEDPGAFTFDDTALGWRDYKVPVRAIGTARAEFATSFGSCSFDEPRDDLRAMGLL